MSPSEIAFLAVGLILGAGVGAAVAEALRSRPAPGRQVRITISPNSIGPRGRSTLSDATPAADRDAPPGSPTDAGSADEPGGPVDVPGVDLPSTELPAPPARTRVPSSPATLPAGAVGVPVEGGSSVPVGPGSPALATAESGPDPEADPPAETNAVLPDRPTSVGLLDRPPAPMTRAPRASTALVSAVDIGAPGPSVAVRPRPTAARPGPLLSASVVAIPVGSPAGRPGARVEGRAGDDALGGPPGITPAIADPCHTPRRHVDERCAVATQARHHAKTAADALREAQRTYDALREHVDRAERVADPREIAAAKDELHRRFRQASEAAADADAGEAAAREWLDAINDLNGRARDAGRFLQSGGEELRAAGPRIERLGLEADAARISAESAESACRDARERLAACEENEVNRAATAGASATAGGSAATADPGEAQPFGAPWTGEPEATWTQPQPDADELALAGPGLPLVIRLLRGDRDALDRLVATLAGADAESARTWRLRVTALVDAIVARAIEDGYLDLPDDDPFWGLFMYPERREVVGALSALGFRFDGLGGFADGRIPAPRDLSLAVGYAGLDRMRIRLPRDAEAGRLYERASVAADEWLAHHADDLSLGEMVDALGSRAADLADLWNAWGRVRPALLSED